MKHSVYYNGKIVAIYKSLKYALAFVAKKGYKNDENNLLFIMAEDGTCYNEQGNEIEEEL